MDVAIFSPGWFLPEMGPRSKCEIGEGGGTSPTAVSQNSLGAIRGVGDP